MFDVFNRGTFVLPGECESTLLHVQLADTLRRLAFITTLGP